jgi:hypothetical protein
VTPTPPLQLEAIRRRAPRMPSVSRAVVFGRHRTVEVSVPGTGHGALLPPEPAILDLLSAAVWSLSDHAIGAVVTTAPSPLGPDIGGTEPAATLGRAQTKPLDAPYGKEQRCRPSSCAT